MSLRTGSLLKSRKTGRENVKIAVIRKDRAQLVNLETGRRWWTDRENLPKSFVLN